MKRIRLLLIMLIGTFSFGCSHDDQGDETVDPVSVLYQAMNSVNDPQILHRKISYADILGYDSIKYAFILTQSASDQINSYFYRAGGMPFSVEANGITIYTGLFFPSYSSSTPCGYLVEPFIGSNHEMIVRLDYGLCSNQAEDCRNNQFLIEQLEKDNKIYECQE